MLKLAITIALVLSAIFLSGCGGRDVSWVSPEEADKLAKLRTGDYDLIAKRELEVLKKAQSVGRYQIRDMGLRTWRFDTALGKVCVLLSSDADWKKEETQNQSCAEEDLRNIRVQNNP
jgi:hypothetical protein